MGETVRRARTHRPVYPAYGAKLERKGRTKAELDEEIEQFFAEATLNPNASSITGVVCGVRVEDVDDPLMQKIRYLDKLVDELAKGKPIGKVVRA
jgi:hypothetical protein